MALMAGKYAEGPRQDRTFIGARRPAYLDAMPPLFGSLLLALRREGFAVGLHEYLALLDALDRGLADGSLDRLYLLARSLFVTHEAWLDRFDEVFDRWSRGLDPPGEDRKPIPPEWLRAELVRHLTPEQREALERDGTLEDLERAFRERLAEQRERHAGGNHWIGTGGTSPFGNGGVHEDGLRLGGEGGQRQGGRRWDERAFRELRDDVRLDTRNIQVALRKLRVLTRQGRADEFDLDGTIQRTSRNGGLLDIALRPERRNRVNVLLLLDSGGSMDDHVRVCEQLFSAARSSFHHLESYYFHNCVYGHVWRTGARRWRERVPTADLFRRLGPHWKLIVVGDAAMAPYELVTPRGTFGDGPRRVRIDDPPADSGLAWLQRLRDHYTHHVWLNPNPDYGWSYFETTGIIRRLWRQRMYPLTLDGLGKAMLALRRLGDSYDEVWTRA
jgi:uncharacterized protein with von Willebrand factor type A (vWA) domain